VIKKNKQKCLVFSFIKLENRSRRVEQILPRGGGWYWWEGGGGGEKL
jgi:hypothetical protein